MKNVLLLSLLILGLLSCSDDELCTAEAYKIEVNSIQTQPSTQSRLSDPVTLDLTADMYIEGDLEVLDLNLNNFNLVVTKKLEVKGDFFGPGTALIFEDLEVKDNVYLYGAYVQANEVEIKGDLTGPGTVAYCENIEVKGNTIDDPTIILECRVVLSDNNLNYELVEVDCDLIGTTKDGYKYVAK